MRAEEPAWNELEGMLRRLEDDPAARLDMAEVRRLQYLYERAASGLSSLGGLAGEVELRARLESLVARAHAEMAGSLRGQTGWRPGRWLRSDFPTVFRRRIRAFALSAAVMMTGIIFGAMVFQVDPSTKHVFLGEFSHLSGNPADRVAEEEKEARAEAGGHAGFAAMLMTHNTRVSVLAMALGMTAGTGTMILLFYNGVIMGVVAADYIVAGQSVFLAGWLLPHGVIEIPAMLIGGQAGLVLGGALLGGRGRRNLRDRMRQVRPDILTLAGGMAVLLVWAGLVESFLSQFHAPVLPYGIKISFGVVELLGLIFWLAAGGRAAARLAAKEALGTLP